MIRLTPQQNVLARDWLPAVSAECHYLARFPGDRAYADHPGVRHGARGDRHGDGAAFDGVSAGLYRRGRAGLQPVVLDSNGRRRKPEPAGSRRRLDRGSAGGAAILRFSKRPLLGAVVGIVLLAILFLTIVGTPRSLRLTTLLTAWTLYLLVDGLLVEQSAL